MSRRFTLPRLLRILMVVFLSLSVLAIAALWYAVYYLPPTKAIEPYRVQSASVVRRFGTAVPWRDAGLPVHEFRFMTADSVQLSAWYVPAERPLGTVIVLHGISSSKEMSWETILSYHKKSYSVVAYDSRAHGASEGRYATMGYREKYDVSACLEHITKHFSVPGPLLLHGFSMGGAIALQALAVEPRISAAIVEGAFCNLRETMHDYAQQHFGFRLEWLNSIIFHESEKKAQFSIDDVCPERALHEVKVPVLFIHGMEDEKISCRYAERNYQALASSNKEIFLVPGGTHLNLGKDSYAEINRRVEGFLERVQQSKCR